MSLIYLIADLEKDSAFNNTRIMELEINEGSFNFVLDSRVQVHPFLLLKQLL